MNASGSVGIPRQAIFFFGQPIKKKWQSSNGHLAQNCQIQASFHRITGLSACLQLTSRSPGTPTMAAHETRPSSFKGRLDMDTFKFKATANPTTQPQQRSPTMAVRRSSRLTSNITTVFQTTKLSTTTASQASPASKPGKKRKAETLAESDLEDSNTVTATWPSTPTLTPTAIQTCRITTKTTTSAQKPRPTRPSSSLSKPPKPNAKRKAAGYVAPSVYAHLPHLPDALAPNLHILFCGLNPGIRTATTGHAYNHPSNRFWKLMSSSGILPVPCTAEQDRSLPARFRLGLTNIVARPTRSGAELSKAEMDEGVSVLDEKVRRWRPDVVCIVGKSIWEAVWRVRHGGRAIGKSEFRYGWQQDVENMGKGRVLAAGDQVQGVVYEPEWKGARVFVATSTSGLAATPGAQERERIWRELGAWVEQRRAGR